MTDVKSQGDPIVIVGAARTPMGGFQGSLKDVAAPRLGAAAINGALRRAGVPKEDVDEVIMEHLHKNHDEANQIYEAAER